MSGYFGLVELILVFAIVLGLGLYELRSVRRDIRKASDTKPTGDTKERK